jgi:hypothetical protein
MNPCGRLVVSGAVGVLVSCAPSSCASSPAAKRTAAGKGIDTTTTTTTTVPSTPTSAATTTTGPGVTVTTQTVKPARPPEIVLTQNRSPGTVRKPGSIVSFTMQVCPQ